MAQHLSTTACEDVPLDEARRMSRGARMAPQLYPQLRTGPQSLSQHAGRMTVSDGMRPTTMKHRIQRVAAERGMPVTIRRVPGGLLFWRSTDEDRARTTEVVARLQPPRPPHPTTSVLTRRPPWVYKGTGVPSEAVWA